MSPSEADSFEEKLQGAQSGDVQAWSVGRDIVGHVPSVVPPHPNLVVPPQLRPISVFPVRPMSNVSRLSRDRQTLLHRRSVSYPTQFQPPPSDPLPPPPVTPQGLLTVRNNPSPRRNLDPVRPPSLDPFRPPSLLPSRPPPGHTGEAYDDLQMDSSLAYLGPAITPEDQDNQHLSPQPRVPRIRFQETPPGRLRRVLSASSDGSHYSQSDGQSVVGGSTPVRYGNSYDNSMESLPVPQSSYRSASATASFAQSDGNPFSLEMDLNNMTIHAR
jgi:hypothetical protein